jgi:NAD(P)-dependent dehydrogenase (short-subunit alcohol dehydrogenase family)
MTSMPLVDRVCVVTGASAGIGFEAARGLARAGARVVLACRSESRAEDARGLIKETVPGADVGIALLDLADPESVRAFARQLRDRHPAIDVLVNNAGVWSASRKTTSAGIELTWATNVLGTHVVTEELLPLLLAAPAARVVNVASKLAYGLQLDDVEFRRRKYSGVAAYAQSKQADRMLAWELARRLEGTSVSVHAMHPGGVSTAIFQKGGGLQGALAHTAARLFGRTPEQGADTIVWLASDPSVATRSGRYWMDRHEASCDFHDPAQEQRLVDLCRRMTAA